MNTYVGLINWTEQGVREVKNSPSRLEAAEKLLKSLGGEMKHFYMTMGEYDMIAIFELPDDAAEARFALTAAGGGAIRTTTLKAFTKGEYQNVIKSLG